MDNRESNRIWQERSRGVASGDYLQAWSSSLSLSAQAGLDTNTQDAIDQAQKINVISATKPYLILQGAGKHRTIISSQDTMAAGGTLMSATAILESDHIIAGDSSIQVSYTADSGIKCNEGRHHTILKMKESTDRVKLS